MINIYYCTDNKLFPQQVLSLISLVRTTNEPLNVINLTVEAKELAPKGKKTSELQDKFCDGLLKSKNPQSSFKSIDVSDLFREHMLKGPNLNNKFYSYFVVVRLLADLIPEIPDKVLYVDSDVMFNKDVKELWDVDVEDFDFAGRKDTFRISNYLQSGVMLMNMKRMREDGSMAKARELCATKKYMCYIDMTAINSACKLKKRISTRFNSYKYTDDCVCYHVCALREGKIPFTKKWWHRIKPDEVEVFSKKVPQMQHFVDEYLTYVKSYPQIFQTAILPKDWETIKENYKTLPLKKEEVQEEKTEEVESQNDQVFEEQNNNVVNNTEEQVVKEQQVTELQQENISEENTGEDKAEGTSVQLSFFDDENIEKKEEQAAQPDENIEKREEKLAEE